MDTIFSTLERLIINAKKSLNKPYAKETIETKKKEITELLKDFENFVIDTKLKTNRTNIIYAKIE